MHVIGRWWVGIPPQNAPKYEFRNIIDWLAESKIKGEVVCSAHLMVFLLTWLFQSESEKELAERHGRSLLRLHELRDPRHDSTLAALRRAINDPRRSSWLEPLRVVAAELDVSENSVEPGALDGVRVWAETLDTVRGSLLHEDAPLLKARHRANRYEELLKQTMSKRGHMELLRRRDLLGGRLWVQLQTMIDGGQKRLGAGRGFDKSPIADHLRWFYPHARRAFTRGFPAQKASHAKIIETFLLHEALANDAGYMSLRYGSDPSRKKTAIETIRLLLKRAPSRRR